MILEYQGTKEMLDNVEKKKKKKVSISKCNVLETWINLINNYVQSFIRKNRYAV